MHYSGNFLFAQNSEVEQESDTSKYKTITLYFFLFLLTISLASMLGYSYDKKPGAVKGGFASAGVMLFLYLLKYVTEKYCCKEDDMEKNLLAQYTEMDERFTY